MTGSEDGMAVGRAGGLDLRVDGDGADDGVYVVAVAGEVDLYSAPDLFSALRELADGGAQHVVVDVTGTSFIDSTGLGVLIAATKMLRLKHGDLYLVGAHGPTERAVYAAGLHTFFKLARSVDAALERI
jgi:anti-sigma B factor antagonist